jgi:hypothetical protein
MSQSPKIKIMLPANYPEEDAFELEQARYRLNFDGGTILVEKQKVRSYDELVQLAAQDKYKNQKYIEITQVFSISC